MSASRIWAALVALTAFALVGCTSSTPGPSAPATSVPNTSLPASPSAPSTPAFSVEPRATFETPWAMAFLPGTPWLAITERTGALHLLDPASGRSVAVAGVPSVRAAGQGGLGDIVPGPTFAADSVVYLSWVEGDGASSGAVVGSARLVVEGDAAHLEGMRVLWRQPPTTGTGHFSQRLAFSPDGAHLFVSSRDRQKMTPAQDLTSGLGAILRLLPDGTPAPGNPFADRGGRAAQVWSYGHRNPLGLAFDAQGRLWSSEMGPQGGDELNLIAAGTNYGWPEASNGSHYGGGEIPDHTPGDGFTAPLAWWTPSESPSSLLIYSGEAFPAWNGDALIGALSGQALIHVDLEGDRVVGTQTIGMGQRIRDVAQGPDGSLWLLEDAPGGRLLALTPA